MIDPGTGAEPAFKKRCTSHESGRVQIDQYKIDYSISGSDVLLLMQEVGTTN